MPFGTWNEVGFVVFLTFLVVLATKISAVGSALGGFFAKKG